MFHLMQTKSHFIFVSLSGRLLISLRVTSFSQNAESHKDFVP